MSHQMSRHLPHVSSFPIRRAIRDLENDAALRGNEAWKNHVSWIFVKTKVSPCYAWAPSSLNENWGKILAISKDFQRNLIGTEPLFTDFSANSALILVEYRHSHVPCPRECFVWIWHYLDQNWWSLSLKGIHTCVHHLVNYSKMLARTAVSRLPFGSYWPVVGIALDVFVVNKHVTLCQIIWC